MKRIEIFQKKFFIIVISFFVGISLVQPVLVSGGEEDFIEQYIKQIEENNGYWPDGANRLTKDLRIKICREYYLKYDGRLDLQDLNIESIGGFSIQDYLDHKWEFPVDNVNTCFLSKLRIDSLEGLENIPNINQVSILYLNNNMLTELDANAFQSLGNLKTLYLEMNEFDTEEINQLKRELPNVWIVSDFLEEEENETSLMIRFLKNKKMQLAGVLAAGVFVSYFLWRKFR